MSLYQKLLNGEEKLALVGLGYVGMPIAVAFANKGIHVVGFDLNTAKIEAYKSGIDPTKEVGDEAIKNTSVDFTSDQKRLREQKFFYCCGSDSSKFRSYTGFDAGYWCQ